MDGGARVRVDIACTRSDAKPFRDKDESVSLLLSQPERIAV